MSYPKTKDELTRAISEFADLNNRNPNIAICPWDMLEAVASWLDPQGPAPLRQIGKEVCGVVLLLGPVFRLAHIEPMKPDGGTKVWPLRSGNW